MILPPFLLSTNNKHFYIKHLIIIHFRWQQAKKTKMANEFLGLKKIKSKLEDVSLSSNDESQEEIENYANYIKQWKEKCKGKKILITCNAPNEIFV